MESSLDAKVMLVASASAVAAEPSWLAVEDDASFDLPAEEASDSQQGIPRVPLLQRKVALEVAVAWVHLPLVYPVDPLVVDSAQ